MKVCRFNGMRETKKSEDWNLLWGMHLEQEEYAKLLDFQKVNHFPGSIEVGHKGKLYANLTRLKRQHPNDFNFLPESFSLPRDAASFERAFYSASESESSITKNDIGPIWIIKPPNSSCGRGIYLATKLEQIKLDKSSVVSRYISNPFLINKRKFDLRFAFTYFVLQFRIYVCVTSLLPLKIYLYNDGLARFCTNEYSLDARNLKKSFVHLTNFSVNKKAAEFKVKDDFEETNNETTGSKWSLKYFLKYIESIGIDPDVIMGKIADLVIKTIISAESAIVSTFLRSNCPPNACFELFGFDILFNDQLQPWIMEVNCFPSLSSSSAMDKRIKTSLVADVFHMIGIEPVDAAAFRNGEMKILEETQMKQKLGLFKSNEILSPTSSRDTALSLPELLKVFNLVPSDSGNNYSALSLCQISALLSRCGQGDLLMLKKSFEENARARNFSRIFPTEKTWSTYGHFFEVHRYSNLLLSLFCKIPKSVVPTILEQRSPFAAFGSNLLSLCQSSGIAIIGQNYSTIKIPSLAKNTWKQTSFRLNKMPAASTSGQPNFALVLPKSGAELSLASPSRTYRSMFLPREKSFESDTESRRSSLLDSISPLTQVNCPSNALMENAPNQTDRKSAHFGLDEKFSLQMDSKEFIKTRDSFGFNSLLPLTSPILNISKQNVQRISKASRPSHYFNAITSPGVELAIRGMQSPPSQSATGILTSASKKKQF